MKINGVLGPIDTADLGSVLMHEHITCADWSLRMNFGDLFFDREEIKKAAILRFSEAKALGIRTVVDATPINLGRDISLIRDVAEGTGLNFIAATGFFYHFEPNLALRDDQQIRNLLIRECSEGIGNTGILPGLFKIAVEAPGMTDYNRKMFRIVGEAAAETGLPVFCHTNPAIRSGDEAADILLACGVPAHRIVLGHSGDSNNPDYLESLLRKGVWLGMDRFASKFEGRSSFACRTAITAELCRRGWSHRLLLSHDSTVYLCFEDYWGAHKESIMEKNQGVYTRLHREIFPELLRLGVPQDTIDRFLTQNPRSFFEG